MAVVYAKQVWTGQTASDDITRHRTYTTEYEVVVNDILDDATVAGGPGTAVPRLGDPYPNDAGAIVVNISPTRDDDNPYRWFVTVSYDTELPFRGESQQINPATGESSPAPSPTQREDNPTLRPAVWKYGFNSYTKIARRARHGLTIVDLDGTAIYNSNPTPPEGPGVQPPKLVPAVDDSILITNSAGDPFDPPIEVEESRLVIDITWTAYGVNHTLLASLIDSVNEYDWYGFNTRTCKVTANEATQKVENGVNCWDRHVVIEVKPESWDLDPVDRGTREWVPGSETPDPDDPVTQSKYVNFKNGDGTEAVELLDGQGRKLADGASPVVMYYRYFKERDFDLLGIP